MHLQQSYVRFGASTLLSSNVVLVCRAHDRSSKDYGLNSRMQGGKYFMPGTKYTKKQERKADHIEESYEKKGVSKKEAEKRAWATVNKQDGGGKKAGGSGRKKSS
jgi:hypothetical protein